MHVREEEDVLGDTRIVLWLIYMPHDCTSLEIFKENAKETRKPFIVIFDYTQ